MDDSCIYKEKIKQQHSIFSVNRSLAVTSTFIIFHWLTEIFFSFQQTPVFWEEEEVSDYPFFSFFFFFFFLSSSPFVPTVLKRLELHSSDLAYWHIYTLRHPYSSRQTLVSISLQVSVWNVAECKTNTLEHGAAHCATRRDGHYFSGLPKNIIIKAMEEIWGSQAWCGNNGLGAPVECYCPIPLFFLSQIWLFSWHDWNNHSSSQGDEVWAKCTELDGEC